MPFWDFNGCGLGDQETRTETKGEVKMNKTNWNLLNKKALSPSLGISALALASVAFAQEEIPAETKLTPAVEAKKDPFEKVHGTSKKVTQEAAAPAKKKDREDSDRTLVEILSGKEGLAASLHALSTGQVVLTQELKDKLITKLQRAQRLPVDASDTDLEKALYGDAKSTGLLQAYGFDVSSEGPDSEKLLVSIKEREASKVILGPLFENRISKVWLAEGQCGPFSPEVSKDPVMVTDGERCDANIFVMFSDSTIGQIRVKNIGRSDMTNWFGLTDAEKLSLQFPVKKQVKGKSAEGKAYGHGVKYEIAKDSKGNVITESRNIQIRTLRKSAYAQVLGYAADRPMAEGSAILDKYEPSDLENGWFQLFYVETEDMNKPAPITTEDVKKAEKLD